MHEMSIATALLDQTLSAVAGAISPTPDGPCVEQVEVSIGILKQVVPEALAMAWQAVREGTLAAEAELALVEVPAQAACRLCGTRFVPAVDDFLCPTCGQADVEIVAGNEIVLTAVTCRDKDECHED